MKGERRFLQHQKPIDLYWEYSTVASQEGDEPASLSTFMKVFKKVFAGHLKFRGAGGSQHAGCDVCLGLKMDYKRSTSLPEQANLMDAYIRHIHSQWRDRQVFWSFCKLSRNYFIQGQQFGFKLVHGSLSTSVATCIEDGMDQAKFRLPRLSLKSWRSGVVVHFKRCNFTHLSGTGLGNLFQKSPGGTFQLLQL